MAYSKSNFWKDVDREKGKKGGQSGSQNKTEQVKKKKGNKKK